MNAVYYCRVSTEEDSQVKAMESQIQEAKKCIENNDWIEIDGYVDEGKSGTATTKRDEYNRLLNDLESDKFEIIVIKSQDRLMRNTKDWYIFIDKLVTNNKKLFFYLENKFYTPDDALITGIKAILAEEYSRDLSKKLNNAHRNRQEKGNSVVITSSTWGYDKINKEVVVNEKEAEIVKLIYDLYIQGYGSRTISKELSNRGIKSRTGKDFAEITIRRIIRNPLFKGTAVMNKRHMDFNTKKTYHNPESEWIYHENAVPPIISSEIWEQANKIMDTKSKEVHGEEFGKRRQGKNLGKFNLSSKIICGECESVYWRRYRKNTKGEQIVDWSCSEYVKRGRKNKIDSRGKNKIKLNAKEGGCDNIHINDNDIYNIIVKISNKVFNKDKNNIIDKYTAVLNIAFSNETLQDEKQQLESEKVKILNQKNILLDKLLDDIITNDDYKRKDYELENRLNQIIAKEETLTEREKEASSQEKRINELKELLEIEGNDEIKVDKIISHIEKIVIFPDYMKVYLDFYDEININIQKGEKGKKEYLYVDTGKYLIPHTDKYHYDGQAKEVRVKLYI
ncbi:MAG: Site-specific recombinase [Anaerocolumna sp.]|jgi:DNA invertase Pin-like site-specific DNA recombinase|nr:Site-specific recombinase [Anaerocolumna sp.]